eukprot:gene20518-27310_t
MQVGASYLKDLFAMFVIDPLQDAVVDGMVEALGAEELMQKATHATNSLIHKANEAKRLEHEFNKRVAFLFLAIGVIEMSRFSFLAMVFAMVFALGNACLLVSAKRGDSQMMSGNRRLLEYYDAPEEDSSSQDCVQYGCMCIFDFNKTLRVVKGWDQDAPPDDAVQVIAECKNLGCGIAIASANGDREKITEVLPRMDSGTFTEDFFNSALFQYGQSDKEITLKAILSCTNVQPNCAAFFDDGEENRHSIHTSAGK